MMADYAMLDLFHQEVNTQVKCLRQSLSILKQQPESHSELEVAVRASRAIAGSAQLVEIEAAALLAETMYAELSAAQQPSKRLSSAQIDRLLHAADLLAGMSGATQTDLGRWLSDHTRDVATTRSAIDHDAGLHQSIDRSDHEDVHQTTIPSVEIIDNRSFTESVEAGDDRSIAASVEVGDDRSLPQLSSLADFSMLDLFRIEVEEQATALNHDLIALETEPQQERVLEALMRSAHSIKGAARIVGIDAAVQLAHGMEDCFVAAQHHELILGREAIDVLLQSVDLLQAIRQVENADLQAWLSQHDRDFAILQQKVSAIQKGDLIVNERTNVIANATSNATQNITQNAAQNTTSNIMLDEMLDEIDRQPLAAIATSPESSESPIVQDRIVRVSAEHLTRIMGLAGESLVEANALPAIADALLGMRSQHNELSKTLELLQQNAMSNATLNEEDKACIETARRQEQYCRQLLNDRLNDLEDVIRRTTNLSDRLYHEVVTSQMRPFEEGMQGFPRMVRDIARELNKQVKLEIVGKTTAVDRDILMKLEAPLTHILRNALDHGIELPEERIAAGKSAEGTIRLEAVHRGGMLSIAISDDGKGIAIDRVRAAIVEKGLVSAEVARRLSEAELFEFLFLPGFSLSKQVTELSGRGVGLDIAKTMAQEVGGTVRVVSQPGKGTGFYFQLPLTLSVIRTLLVDVAGEVYAFPLARIDRVVKIDRSEIATVERRQYMTLDDQNIGLVALHQVLDLSPTASNSDAVWVVVLNDQSTSYGLVVDRCLGERELVVRPLDPRLGKVQDVSAAAFMNDGSLALILDISDLLRSLHHLLFSDRVEKITTTEVTTNITTQKKEKRVLVVDDSITVREMERKLLQNHGYDVDVAVDGMEGWNAVRSQDYDLVVSDIDMPRMNGIELIKEIKRHPRLQSIPVIVVSYRDREEDRLQGLEAGADYYLTKSSFHDDTLIRAVVDLIGES